VTNAKLNNVTNVEFICGVSERIFSKVSHFPRDNTVIIIDPPRKGCDEPFLKQLFAFLPKALVYVSCDPATQARDAKEIVAAGYSIVDVSPFDLFPQTRHIENVMTFVRNV
jgi:tRNA/tmRNA/rRNA uracil-C5-methylase (TrmA/RlmC/RlmD family)